MNKYGIFWSPDNNDTCSLIISARKPGVPTFRNLRYRNAHLQKKYYLDDKSLF